MKTVVAFIGSPRKNSNTQKIVKEVVHGATEAGATTKIYYLNQMNIKPFKDVSTAKKPKLVS
jgi:multimeric flavodoxin WrbA